jgi:hypothetical protein
VRLSSRVYLLHVNLEIQKKKKKKKRVDDDGDHLTDAREICSAFKRLNPQNPHSFPLPPITYALDLCRPIMVCASLIITSRLLPVYYHCDLPRRQNIYRSTTSCHRVGEMVVA